MKLSKLATLVMLAGLVGATPRPGQAQHLAYAEYFIDTDPGQGNGTSILSCDGVFDEAIEEFCVDDIPTPYLDDGPHAFFLRMRDSNGVWGMRQKEFYVTSSSPYADKQIQAAEYFIDHDPGPGMGTPLESVDGMLNSNLEYLTGDSVVSGTLALGQHVLYARVQDTYGVWSRSRQVPFEVVESLAYRTLTAAEYFIDTDPGKGKGVPLSAVDVTFDESYEAVRLASIGVDSLCPGDHTVYVRFRDNGIRDSTQRNPWGPVKGQTLHVYGRPCPPSTVTTTGLCEKIELYWSASPLTTVYQIVRDGAWLANVTTLGYVDTVTQPGWHTYWLRAGNDLGFGDSVVVKDSAFLPPAAISLVVPDDGAVDRPAELQICWDSTGNRGARLFHVEVSRVMTFLSHMVADAEVSDICYALSDLHKGITYYWRVQGQNDCGWGEWSQARRFTTAGLCCDSTVGDVNGAAGNEPTIGDVSLLIDAKFVSGSCDMIPCLAEADINQSGGANPTCDDLTIGDISILIDYLFITGPSMGLKGCL